MKDIKIIVAAHKPYWMPEDLMYLPVQVGAAGKESIGFQRDDTGENISTKNPNYCELSGLYWAWKNTQADYLGLVHYRRYFYLHKGNSKQTSILTNQQADQMLSKTDIVLPKPRNYFIETNYSQYVHAHHAIDLDTVRQVLAEKYPMYLSAFDIYMKRTIGHRFNMFIMKKSLADDYCTWLFDVLLELEKRLDISSYSANDARVFGFISERLLDVWINTNHLSYRELPYVFLENQNWLIKIWKFLCRKFHS